jgi:transmembrane sensor
VTEDDWAARWAIRLDNAPLTDDEAGELEQWLAEDERRQGMLLRAEATLSYLGRARALSQGGAASAEEVAPEPLPAAARRVPWWRGVAVAACTLTLVVFASLAGRFVLPSRAVEIRTEVGEVRELALADGSFTSVNTDSKMEVAMRPERREVVIEDGEAWFRVAHDKSRPFVVAVGDIRVQAIGTAFSVRKLATGADVVVSDGVVEVWVVGREEERTRIAAGSKGSLTRRASSVQLVRQSYEVDRALAWREGGLSLNGETLGYAVQELNRYNTRKLVIDDPALARESLVGYFRVDQPENFGRAAAEILGARMRIEGDTVHLQI